VEREHAALAERLRRTGAVVWVTATVGLYDVVAYCCVANASTMLTMIDDHVLGAPGVRAVSLAPILEFYTPVFRIAAGEENRHGARGQTQRSLDDTDRAMVRELQRDGRLSYADLAQRIGISATSAADRFRRLTADGIIDIVTFVDPPRMGMNLSGAFLIAASGPLRPLMKRLGQNPELTFLTALAGKFPGYVTFNCRDEDAYHDLRARILATEGVHDVQSLLFSTLYHESVEWGSALGEDSATESPPSSEHAVSHANHAMAAANARIASERHRAAASRAATTVPTPS